MIPATITEYEFERMPATATDVLMRLSEGNIVARSGALFGDWAAAQNAKTDRQRSLSMAGKGVLPAPRELWFALGLVISIAFM